MQIVMLGLIDLLFYGSSYYGFYNAPISSSQPYRGNRSYVLYGNWTDPRAVSTGASPRVRGLLKLDNSTGAQNLLLSIPPPNAPSGPTTTTVTTNAPSGPTGPSGATGPPPPPPPPPPGGRKKDFLSSSSSVANSADSASSSSSSFVFELYRDKEMHLYRRGSVFHVRAASTSLAPFWGLVRFESFECEAAGGLAIYYCPVANLPASSIAALCSFLPMEVVGQTFPPGGLVTYSGNFDVTFRNVTALSNIVEFVMVFLDGLKLPTLVPVDVWGRALMSTEEALLTGASLGVGDSSRSVQKVFGVYSDVSRFLLHVSILLALECVLSLLLTWQRRHFQFIMIVIGICMICTFIFLSVNTNIASFGDAQQANRTCMALGFLLHLSLASSIGWYAAISVNLFFVFFFPGRYVRFAYHFNVTSQVMYHVVVWSYVLVTSVIVWGLYGANPTWSFGPLQPWQFCWIGSSSVLLGVFFIPSFIVLALNITLTTIMVVFMCRVRANSPGGRGLNVSAVMEIVSVATVVNGGTLAIGLLGILLIVYASTPTASLFLISSIVFFVQAATFWLVVFPRSENMNLWALAFTCSLRPVFAKPKTPVSIQLISNSKKSSTTKSTANNTPNPFAQQTGASSEPSDTLQSVSL